MSSAEQWYSSPGSVNRDLSTAPPIELDHFWYPLVTDGLSSGRRYCNTMPQRPADIIGMP
jgi:hypothetical protein